MVKAFESKKHEKNGVGTQKRLDPTNDTVKLVKLAMINFSFRC